MGEAQRRTAEPEAFLAAVDEALNALKAADAADSARKNPETGWRSDERCDAYSRLLVAPELLDIVLLFERAIEYEIRKSRSDGDEEGARLKTVTLNLVRDAIDRATGSQS